MSSAPSAEYLAWKRFYIGRRSRIDIMERVLSRLEYKMSNEEAKMYLDHSIALYDKLDTAESLLLQSAEGIQVYNEIEPDSIDYRIKAIQVRLKLTRRLSQMTSTKVTTPEPSPSSKLQSLINKQKFHIEQIESFGINDDVCPVKAQVLYEHVSKLYDRFISNQDEINAQVDDAALADQRTIASQIQSKVADIQVKLKKTMTSEISELDSLVKKSDFLIHQIKSLESKSSICADKAKISYNQLASLYDSFLSNQMKIQTQLTGDTLETQRKISTEVQQNVIESLTNFKKIFEATVAVPVDFFQRRSTTIFSESGSTITQDTLEETKTPDDIHSNENSSINNDFHDTGEHLEISRDIQSDVRSMKETQKQLQEDSKSIKEALKSILLENQKNASLRSSSVNFSQTDKTDQQLEISRDIKNDVYSMKEKQNQLQEDLKSMKDDLKLITKDLKSTQLEKEKANLSSINSSQTVGSTGMQKKTTVIEEQGTASESDALQQIPKVCVQSGLPDYTVQWIEYYRSIGMHREAAAIEALMKAKEQTMYQYRTFNS